MKTVIALCVAASAVFFSPAASADAMVARFGKDSVTILASECPKNVAALFPPEVRNRLRAAYATEAGKHLKGCWMLVNADVVLALFGKTLYEFPSAAFKNQAGV